MSPKSSGLSHNPLRTNDLGPQRGRRRKSIHRSHLQLILFLYYLCDVRLTE